MEIYYLISILLLLFFISWIVGSLNPISPSAISVTMYLASILLLAAGPKSLHKDLSEYTIFVIILALLAFFIGDMAARLSINSTKIIRYTSWMKPIRVGKWTYMAIVVFSIVTLIWSYFSVMEMATAVGYREGDGLMIQYGRLAVLQYEMRPSAILIIFGFMLRAISYVFTFAYLYNKILCREKIKLCMALLFPSLVYLLQYMLWGSRGAVIEYISFFIFLYAYFKSRVTQSHKDFNVEALSLSAKWIALFFLIFSVAGSLKGWADLDPFEIFSIYGGGSIAALNNYLNNPIQSTNVFGEETLLGIHSLLERVGISSFSPSRILEFTVIGQTEVTNIYTSIRRYINDYGILGMICIQFTLGYLFSAGFLYLQQSRKIGYFALFYAMLFMLLVYQAIDEQALTSFLSTTQIFTVLFTYFFFSLLLKSKLNVAAQGAGTCCLAKRARGADFSLK